MAQITQNEQYYEPLAKKIKHIVKFGTVEGEYRGSDLMNPPITIEDDYYWLRNDDRTNEEVLDYLNKNNEYTQSVMGDTKDLQKQLYQDIKSRVKETYDTHPYPTGGGGWNSQYRYFTRTVEGKSYEIYCRLNMITQDKEVLLDVNKLADGKTTYDVSGFEISDDHKILAYGIDENGDEKYDIHFMNIETFTYFDKQLTHVPYADFTLAPDNKTIFYTMGDGANRINKLYRTSLDSNDSELLFEENDTLFSIGISVSKTNRFLFLETSSYDMSEQYFLDLTNPNAQLVLVHPRTDMLKYTLSHHEDNFIILTNKDGATNFKLMYTPVLNYGITNWKNIRDYNDKEYIEGYEEFKNYIVVQLKYEGLDRLAIVQYDGSYSNEWKHILIDEEVYTLGLAHNNVYDTDNLWYSYSSLTQPLSLFEHNLLTRKQILLKNKEVPNYNSNNYVSKRIMVPSQYGVKVPVSIVYRKDLQQNITNPLYLYAYGSYGMTIDPSFNSQIITLLDRGYIYAIAHVRGGSYLGYDWYLDGKMHNKMNTFTDFNACAEFLIRERYTEPSKLVIDGRSAGGLTVSASMVLRPDLFNTVISGVPFVDVLVTMADPSIPLTTPEWEQWGNPNKREDYICMKQYSPIDNLRKVNYPNTLFLAGLNDPRVQYWEPAKFIAKLREYRTDNNLHLLKVEMDEGHFGGNDRYRHMKETAFIYAFILKTIN